MVEVGKNKAETSRPYEYSYRETKAMLLAELATHEIDHLAWAKQPKKEEKLDAEAQPRKYIPQESLRLLHYCLPCGSSVSSLQECRGLDE
jgi:hypothetical protein